MIEKSFKMFIGPMWSSKTTHLLMELERCKFQQRKCLLFKPRIDDRYTSSPEIVSHAGYRWPAVLIDTGDDILKFLVDNDDYDLIALDEAFMVPNAAKSLVWLFRNSYNIVVSSLDLGSHFQVFDEVREMMPWATDIKKLDAACSVCHGTARYTYKKKPFENQDSAIQVGGTDDYEPRCFKCHPNFRV